MKGRSTVLKWEPRVVLSAPRHELEVGEEPLTLPPSPPARTGPRDDPSDQGWGVLWLRLVAAHSEAAGCQAAAVTITVAGDLGGIVGVTVPEVGSWTSDASVRTHTIGPIPPGVYDPVTVETAAGAQEIAVRVGSGDNLLEIG